MSLILARRSVAGPRPGAPITYDGAHRHEAAASPGQSKPPKAPPSSTDKGKTREFECLFAQETTYDLDAAMDALTVVIRERQSAPAPGPGLRASARIPLDVLGECLHVMGVAPDVASQVCTRDVRALYVGRHLPFALTLGAAVVLHAAHRGVAAGLPLDQVLELARGAAARAVELTPDRTFAEQLRAKYAANARADRQSRLPRRAGTGRTSAPVRTATSTP